MSNPKGKFEGEKMEQYSVRMTPTLWETAKQKAGFVPLSVVIRILIEKWLSGEIVINLTKKD